MAGILTAQQQQQAWHDLVASLGQTVCPFSVTDLVAAVQAADAWCTANAASFSAALPAPFSTGATAAQKAALLAYVVTRRYTG
jgi:hypothetical protein